MSLHKVAWEKILPVARTCIAQERGNAWRASLGKIARKEYLNRYEVKFIRPDGSTIFVPSAEPRKTFQAAVDLNKLSEDERRQRLAARKPKTKAIKQETIDDNFDETEYMKFWSTATPEEKHLNDSKDNKKPKKAK